MLQGRDKIWIFALAVVLSWIPPGNSKLRARQRWIYIRTIRRSLYQVYLALSLYPFEYQALCFNYSFASFMQMVGRSRIRDSGLVQSCSWQKGKRLQNEPCCYRLDGDAFERNRAPLSPITRLHERPCINKQNKQQCAPIDPQPPCGALFDTSFFSFTPEL